MRTKTLASLLVLCGSTAALAQVTNLPGGSPQNNATVNSVANQPMDMPDNATPPPVDNAADNTIGDAPNASF